MKKILCIIIFILSDKVLAAQLPFDYSIETSDSRYDEETGRSDAKAHLRLGELVILVPGGPPNEIEYKIRRLEYGKCGVDWNITGDVSNPDFEKYRVSFNSVMEVAINKLCGADFINKTESNIKKKIDAKK